MSLIALVASVGTGLGLALAVVSGVTPREIVRRLRVLRVQYWGVLALGAVLSLAVALDANMLAGRFALGVSFSLLLAGCLLNQHITGTRVVAFGLAANLGVLLVNGYVPMSQAAVVAAGIIDFEGIDRVLLGAARRWSDDATIAAWLGGAIPLAPLRDVVSLGDVVTAAGLANVGFRLMSPAARDRQRREAAARRHSADHDDASVVLRPAAQVTTLEHPPLASFAAPTSPDAAARLSLSDSGVPTVTAPLAAIGASAQHQAPAPEHNEPAHTPARTAPAPDPARRRPAWTSRVEPAPWPAPAPWPQESWLHETQPHSRQPHETDTFDSV
ncbi:DUF5317 family protein [Candidatus Poriferisodalis sp.]|uniref:DUF5317 family protein n=1 Tax=Candidatus Poriferisodalis sp. TaxID=3101277 RepID=UPI003B012CB3